MSTIQSLIDTLRADVDVGSFSVETQQLYERWLKQNDWAARTEVLPLVIGVAPEQWAAYLHAGDLAAAEQALWSAYQRDATIVRDADRIAVDAAVSFFRNQHVNLPASFARLYDFVRQTTLGAERPVEPSLTDIVATRDRAEETEAVLGAALSLVASMPDRCRDEHGFVDGGRIAQLIMQAAVRWFPLQPPKMSEAEMAALIDKWLA